MDAISHLWCCTKMPATVFSPLSLTQANLDSVIPDGFNGDAFDVIAKLG